jgi:hypothetical protein
MIKKYEDEIVANFQNLTDTSRLISNPNNFNDYLNSIYNIRKRFMMITLIHNI